MIPKILETYRNSTFIGGQLLIHNMTVISRILHNFTINSIQLRLFKHRLTIVIIPI